MKTIVAMLCVGALLGGCATNFHDKSKYETGPFGANKSPLAQIESVTMRGDLIGPYCFDHHGYLSDDARGCAILAGGVCKEITVPKIADQREGDLIAWEDLICAGWHPGLKVHPQ